MVCMVKAGELCGTTAGLHWHHKTRIDERGIGRRGEGEGPRDSADTGGGVQLLEGISASWEKFRAGTYYKRGGRSSWIEIRESSVRSRTNEKQVQ